MSPEILLGIVKEMLRNIINGKKIAEIKFFKKLRIKLIFINNVILCIANPFANSLSQNKQAIDYCLNYILVWLKIFYNRLYINLDIKIKSIKNIILF